MRSRGPVYVVDLPPRPRLSEREMAECQEAFERVVGSMGVDLQRFKLVPSVYKYREANLLFDDWLAKWVQRKVA